MFLRFEDIMIVVVCIEIYFLFFRFRDRIIFSNIIENIFVFYVFFIFFFNWEFLLEGIILVF